MSAGATVDEVAFLDWALPRLQLRPRGFRRVRNQVVKRLRRRYQALHLPDLDAYRRVLEERADEWAELDALCRVTISRFARDARVWARLVEDVLPRLAREADGRVQAWSAGCGAGEEPYTLAIAWRLAGTGVPLDVLASDAHEHQLERAARATYPPGTLRELPAAWREAAFERAGDELRVRDAFRAGVRFVHHDLRRPPPLERCDLLLCRNLAFTYFDEPLQRDTIATFLRVLRPGGFLVLGLHEQLPADTRGFSSFARSIFQRQTAHPASQGERR